MMRFDYYAARVEADPRSVIPELQKLGHEVRRCDGLAKSYHYDFGFQVHHHQKGLVATVMMGGNNGPHPFAFASSDATDSFVDLVRTNWPDRHLPTRMDPVQDFNDSRAFKRLRKICRDVAKARRLAFPAIVDDLNPNAGRTQYLGSPGSDYRVRLYEKGWEQVGKLGIASRGLPDDFRIRNEATGELVKPADWVRLEGQCRPKGEEARRLAAIATPEQAWGFTPWMHELAKRAMAIDLERLYIRTGKRSTDEQALRWMCGQYANVLQRLRADLGDWQSVGLTIGEIIQER